MSRWYWFYQNLKEIFKSLVTNDSKARYWLVTQDRLEKLTAKEKKFEVVKAEAEMWHNISELYKQRLVDAVYYVREQWGKSYEK